MLLVKTRALSYPLYMNSVAVIQSHVLLVMGRSLCGKCGTYEITSVFCTLASSLDSSFLRDQLETLECFVVLLYDRTSTEMTVIAARKQLFSQKRRSIDNLPPTQAALIVHIKRAAYQSGHICWYQLLLYLLQVSGTGHRQVVVAGK